MAEQDTEMHYIYDGDELDEGFVYDEGGPAHRTPFKMRDDMPATEYWKKHVENHFLLRHIERHSTDARDKIQAGKEIETAGSRMKFWERHPNFDPKEAQKHVDMLKKSWRPPASLPDRKSTNKVRAESTDLINTSELSEEESLSVHKVRAEFSDPAQDDRDSREIHGIDGPMRTRYVQTIRVKARNKAHALNKVGAHLSKSGHKVHSMTYSGKVDEAMNPQVAKLLALRQRKEAERRASNVAAAKSDDPAVNDFLAKGGSITKARTGSRNIKSWKNNVPVHKSGKVVGKASRYDFKLDEASDNEEVRMTEGKFAPRPLKDIVERPARKHNEYKGNTADEKAIVARIDAAATTVPDANGNGDDVFKAAKIKRVHKPINPGDDEKKYSEWNGDVANIDEVSKATVRRYLNKEDLDEDFGAVKRPVPINHNHIDMHWATQHVAPTGSKIEVHDNKVVLHHPDGEVHHFEGGQRHVSEVKYDTKDKSGRTDAEAGKYNIIRHGSGNGYRTREFVSSKKEPKFGFVKTTHDELKAKEFKSLSHAQNHVNYHSQHVGDFDVHFSIHPKRNPAQVRAGVLGRRAAAKAQADAVTDATDKGIDPRDTPKYRRAVDKMVKHTHPGLRY